MTPSAFSTTVLPQTLCGPGTLDKAADAIPPSARCVVVVADPAMTALGLVARLTEALEGSGRSVAVFDDVRSDPTEAQVMDAVGLIDGTGAQTVVAFGGGSALDAGKTAAALAGHDADVSRFRLGAEPLPTRRTGLLAVPTTAGTGSEATRTAIVTGDDHVKYWFWGEPLRFDGVILDPHVTVSLPMHLTAATGADALVHAIESSTNVNASPASRLWGHEAIRLLAAHLPDAVADPENIEARGAVLWAAYVAGCALDHASAALAHCFGHALGSMAQVHHGRAVSIAMAAGAEIVADANPGPFAAVAAALGARADHTAFPAAFQTLMERIGLDLSLPADAVHVTAENLVATAMQPANSSMWHATVGPIGREGLGAIAERIVARAPAFV